MVRMLIVADDLTGAADCGVACAGHGLRTLLVAGDAGSEVDADALTVDANTRSLGAEEAARETGRLVREYGSDRGTLLYKKVDSTLRGNVGAELAATLEVRRSLTGGAGNVVAVLAPAFPAMGRTTVDGRQLVHGEPVGASGLELMMRAAGLNPTLLELSLVRSSGDGLRDAMEAARDSDVLVCDAETEHDLRKIAEAGLTLERDTVWAGSGGLAWQLLPAAGLAGGRLTWPETPQVAGPVLFVVGTGSRVSLEQAEVLCSRSNTIGMKFAPEVLLAGESTQWREERARLERALNEGKDVVVSADAGDGLEKALAAKLSAGLAELVRAAGDKVGALVATGGETARAVFDAWGVKRLRLIGEVEPGLPYSVTVGWKRELPVLTKAGGFGVGESLVRCREFLRGE